jgi:hypothetical protein
LGFSYPVVVEKAVITRRGIRYLPSVYMVKINGLELGVAGHTWNPSTWEAKAGELIVQGAT